MDKRISYRLTGSIFIIALAVILLPIVLDGDASERLVQQATIPPAPDVDTASVHMLPDFDAVQKEKDDNLQIDTPLADTQFNNKLMPVSDLQNTHTVEVHPTSKPSVNDSVVEKKLPKITQDVVQSVADKPASSNAVPQQSTRFDNSAYMIQLGTFGSENNATKLATKLRKLGHVVTIKTTENNQHRVLVGPYLKKDQAKEVREKLLAQTKLSGIVVSY